MSEFDRSGPFWDSIFGRRPLPAMSQLLGWKLRSLDPRTGSIVVEFLARPEFVNAYGTVQGGILAAMLDDAMSPAAAASYGGNCMARTIELKITQMRPTYPGPIFVEGKVVLQEGPVAFLEGRIRDLDGNLVAAATATAKIIEWRDDLAHEISIRVN
jgi:uncharacterized protein (TIGR00369 family)